MSGQSSVEKYLSVRQERMASNTTSDWAMDDDGISGGNSTSFLSSFLFWDGTPEDLEGFKVLCEVLMAVTIATTNLAIGSLLNRDEFKRQNKFPGYFVIGCFCQFVLYPVVVYGLVQVLQIDYACAVGMLMTCVAPTSPIASLLTFFVDGNIYISVTMTIVSTIMSMGMIPALFYFLAGTVTIESFQAPAYALLVGLLHVCVPLSVGIFFRYILSPFWNKLIVLLGLAFGLAGFGTMILLQFAINNALLEVPLKVYYALAILPVVAYLIGYGMGSVGKQNSASKKAFAISMVYHNMAISLLALSSPIVGGQEWIDLATFPSLYTPVTGIYGLAGVLLYLTCFPKDDDFDRKKSHVIRTRYKMLQDEDFPEPSQNRVLVSEDEKPSDRHLGMVGRGGEIMRIDSITMPTVTKEYTS